MRRITLFITATAFCFACNSKPEKTTESPEPTLDLAEAETEPEVIADGQKIYSMNCTPCHGVDGKLGVGGAKDFALSELNVEEKIEVITNGRNTMLAYGNILSAAEITAVAGFVETLKD